MSYFYIVSKLIMLIKSMRFYKIPAGSLLPTIMAGDWIVTLKVWSKENIKRKDLIVFPYPPEPSINYIKRVIGLPGEKLEIKSSVTALGVMTALCTLGGCAMLFNPSEALASTTHILELAESNADALDPETAKTIAGFLGPLFAISEILFIVRIVMTWYPSVPITKLPWVVAYVPTEPLLKPTRTAIPPVGGVDVSPIVWVGVISFFNEILLGKQGLLVLLSNKTMA